MVQMYRLKFQEEAYKACSVGKPAHRLPENMESREKYPNLWKSHGTICRHRQPLSGRYKAPHPEKKAQRI